MAEREDIRQRSIRLNPQAAAAGDEIERILVKHGLTGPIVELTEDMTPEEEEMAMFEGLLKERVSPEEAEVKAKQKIELFRKVFNY